MTIARIAILVLLALAVWSTGFDVADAQAVCEGNTGNGRCNSNNSISGTLPTANNDATPFNDYASVEAVFGPNAGVCAATVGVTVKNLGPLGAPVTPLPNTVVTSKLGPLGLPNGKVFVALRAVDLVGNRGGCSAPEMSFTNDNVAPSAITNVNVGP